MVRAVALGLMSVLALAQTAMAQTDPLNFGNNFFVTGDYVVAGVGLRGLGNGSGFATGTITMPDANTVPSTGVPAGAQVVAALLYWQTVESSQTTFAGQHGFFGPYNGVPFTGYSISGAVLGNPNAPVSWSSGGCSGNSQGSKTIRTYRADVRAFLPVDSEGNVEANGTYGVRLADSGSNGGGVPLTLGATLVIIYRLLDKSEPLNSVVIYDGSFAPSNTSSDMIQAIEGFYEAGVPPDQKNPKAKLTEIVGNGQPNKNESVYLNYLTNPVNLPSLYGNSSPPFPGYYNQSWDNPTWIVNSYGNAVQENDSSETASVMPAPTNSGCVSWGAVIFSTTVQDTDGDGLLDVWEKDGGYCDASINGGDCNHNSSDPAWVSLPDADPNKKDIYVQMDYMCRDPIATKCDPTDGSSFLPIPDDLNKVMTVFANHGIDLHLIPGNPIQQTECTDDPSASPPLFCPVPNQYGVVGWKGGFAFLKNQPLNYPDEDSCEKALDGPCIRRFQHGRKDSYHYALFGNQLDAPSWNWANLGGTLTGVAVSGGTVTFNTKTDPRFDTVTNPTGVDKNDPTGGNGRVTVSGVVSDPNFNGTFNVTGAGVLPNGNFYFSIQDNNLSPTSAAPTWSTDPHLAIASGQAGTISGASDVGGEDTAVTLGSWGAAGESDTVQEGIFMHELGHTLGLTHGGTYYDTSGSYVPMYEPNCKPNYQSVMNYLFTVDLLGTSQTLDYSEQELSTLDENHLPAGVTTTDGSTPYYSTTRWYSTSPPGGVGTPAKVHCDGTPILPTDVQPRMYRVVGDANKISPPWASPEDVTFNGVFDSKLRGYDDWTNLDLRQMGAAGNLSTAGGPGAAFNFGPGAAFNFGPGAAFNFGPGAALDPVMVRLLWRRLTQ
jgi:hypothetical protein